MLDIDISVLGEHINAQFKRLQVAKKDGNSSKIRREILRTRAVIEVSRRVILYSYIIRKYRIFATF